MTTLDRRLTDDTFVLLMVKPENQPCETTVLVVFRQRSVAKWIGECLRKAGYLVAVAEGYDDGLRALHFIEPDAAIVNASKVEGDFKEFLSWLVRRLPAGGIPTVFVGPRKIQASLAAIAARRRSRTAFLSWPLKCKDLQHIMLDLFRTDKRSPDPHSGSQLVLDSRLRVLHGWAGSTILTPDECRLARYLISHGNKTVSVEEALTRVFGFYPGNGNASLVWGHLRSLRQKIRIVTGGTDLIRTVGKRGFAYLGT